MNKDREGIEKVINAVLIDKQLYNLTSNSSRLQIVREIADGILVVKPEAEPEMMKTNMQKYAGEMYSELEYVHNIKRSGHELNDENWTRIAKLMKKIKTEPEEKPEPEMMICKHAIKGSHAVPHIKNEVCAIGHYKCVPYVPEAAKPAVELPEETDMDTV